MSMKPTKKADGAATKAPEAVVYLGPTIPRLVSTGTVFAGGKLPEALENKANQVPALRALIVPVSQYAEAVQGLKKPGRLKTLYEAVANKL